MKSYTLILLSFLLPVLRTEAKPIKVFILAGQSNMEGHARIETFDYLGDDPATAPLLKQMRATDGTPAAANHTWISYYTGHYEGNANGEGTGKLTAGYGARDSNPTQDGGKIGPEFTFGLAMDATLKEPVLLIKTAWGGRSLNTEFRPPSAGPYVFSDAQIEQMKKQGRDLEAEKAKKARESGRFYHLMIDHVQSVLADPKRVCPAYNPADGYEVAGFVWFQGFNDLVDGNTYPMSPDGKTRDYSKYTEWLAHLIRDVRNDLNAPKMPFVIGVLGVDGLNAKANTLSFREAMAAPASMPDFQGNVVAVQTAPFWPEELAIIDQKHALIRQMAHLLKVKDRNGPNKDGSMDEAWQREYLKRFESETVSPEEAAKWKRGASNAGYHYLGCAKTFALIGRAFAEANLGLLSRKAP